MSLTKVLHDLGYSDQFIGFVENSFVDDSPYGNEIKEEQCMVECFDSATCFLQESCVPVMFNVISEDY